MRLLLQLAVAGSALGVAAVRGEEPPPLPAVPAESASEPTPEAEPAPAAPATRDLPSYLGQFVPTQPAPPGSVDRRRSIPFGRGSGIANSIHERLRARRLSRVQQMRQSAERSGDAERVQQADLLEGLVNQLHDQGLFNFGQNVITQMQHQRATPAAEPSVAVPETDLGESAPLDFGEPAPLELNDDGQTTPPAAGEKPLELPPAPQVID